MRANSTHLIIPFFIPHQGCPHQCRFCNQRVISGTAPSAGDLSRSLEATVRSWISHSASRRYTDIEIAFYGGTFLALNPDCLKLLLDTSQAFIDRGEVHGIRFSTRPDPDMTAALHLIRGYKVRTVELGVQSMDDTILAMSNRGHTAADVVHAVRVVRDHGLKLGVQLMVGLPGDTPERLTKTVCRVIALKPDFLRLYPTLVVNGSPLATDYRNGRYQALSVTEAVEATFPAYVRFRKAGIPVIRMGLQATADLDAGTDIIAGPYHPAFGQLVQSRLYLALIRHGLSKSGFAGRILTLGVAAPYQSTCMGQRRHNLAVLKRTYGIEAVCVTAADLPPETVTVNGFRVSLADLLPDESH
ncbi:MAG: radical SAM protein [Deltaproteobacteria bacterium]|nr:MAG: radical SAM protein [Deltaproteobacteria bacterium]